MQHSVNLRYPQYPASFTRQSTGQAAWETWFSTHQVSDQKTPFATKTVMVAQREKYYFCYRKFLTKCSSKTSSSSNTRAIFSSRIKHVMRSVTMKTWTQSISLGFAEHCRVRLLITQIDVQWDTNKKIQTKKSNRKLKSVPNQNIYMERSRCSSATRWWWWDFSMSPATVMLKMGK